LAPRFEAKIELVSYQYSKLRLADKVITKCQSLRNVCGGIHDRLTLIEAIWTKLDVQPTIVYKIAASGQLDLTTACSQFDCSMTLQSRLFQAGAQLQIDVPGPYASSITRLIADIRSKLKYAFVKDSLDELLAELENDTDDSIRPGI
jgi:hypothetical protein